MPAIYVDCRSMTESIEIKTEQPDSSYDEVEYGQFPLDVEIKTEDANEDDYDDSTTNIGLTPFFDFDCTVKKEEPLDICDTYEEFADQNLFDWPNAEDDLSQQLCKIELDDVIHDVHDDITMDLLITTDLDNNTDEMRYIWICTNSPDDDKENHRDEVIPYIVKEKRVLVRANCLKNINMETKKRSYCRKYRCSTCEHASYSASNLAIHERIHSGEKPFACQRCTYKSNHKSNLTRHMHTHQGRLAARPQKLETSSHGE